MDDGIRVWLNIFANSHITHGICNIIVLQKLDIIVINGGAADSGNADSLHVGFACELIIGAMAAHHAAFLL
jgi:hypothetical protein